MNPSPKWNIHWMLEEPLYSDIVRCNQRLVKECSSEIDFVGQHRPHITLIMGELTEGQSAAVLEDRVKQLAQKLRPIMFIFGKPYIESTKGRYVFLDPIDSTLFLRSKALAGRAVANVLRPSVFGGSANPPHLSLAYIPGDCPRFNDIGLQVLGGAATVRRIGLSQCDVHGTCLEEVVSFDVT